jgi:type II secretory pathway pseudopilin PulG
MPMATRKRMAARLLDERGFTIVELLVVALVMIVVVTAVFGLYRVAATEQERVGSSTKGLSEQRIGLERMTRELRQATTICQAYPTCGTTFSNASSVDFQRCRGGSGTCTQVWVRYNCSGTPAQTVPPAVTTRACLRSESSAPTGLGSAEKVVVANVATSPAGIFTFTQPNFLAIAMRVSVKGFTNPISLQDGVRARNVNETVDSGEQGS